MVATSAKSANLGVRGKSQGRLAHLGALIREETVEEDVERE
jgi:hypothetical protein